MGKLNTPSAKKSASASKIKSIADPKKFKSDKKKKTLKHPYALKVSTPTSGIRKIISKKEKQKMKKQKLDKQVALTKAAFKEDKAKKKRMKTPVVGDLKPLLDSLPSLDELLTIRDPNKTGIASIDRKVKAKQPKSKSGRRELQRHEKTEKMLDRFDHVQKIWRDPEFQKNPRKLIAEQVRKRRLANEMET